MLLTLSVRDFIIVESMSLEFGDGLTVLTGETGAGKSIILQALGLLLGDRAEGGLVREGQQRTELSALLQIDCSSPIIRWLDQQALANENNTVLIRRIIDCHGRSRHFINGSSATLAQLKELGDFLVDIHGQHAHQSLLRSPTQRALLDAYAQADPLVDDVQQAWQQWQQAKKACETAQVRAQQSQAERERLAYQINELTALNLQPDEWVLLNQAHLRLAHAAELLQTTQLAVDTLSDIDGNCLSVLSTLQNRLNKLAATDAALTDTVSLLDSASTQLREAVYQLRNYSNSINEDPSELAAMEQRISQLLSVARQYRVQPPELLTVLVERQQQLTALEEILDIDTLADAEEMSLARYSSLAQSLSRLRRQAANDLARCVTEHMQSLAMSSGHFMVDLIPLSEPSSYGVETVEYSVAVSAGAALRPLAKVASGGELSRISLALQVAISQVANVPTLIFDEVDVGIGGRVATIVGKLLRQLGKHYQVLCVTHLPQVAACGQQHWHISKSEQDGQISSHIRILSPQERVMEIARMLGGTHMTATTHQHAAEMLAADMTIDESEGG